VNDAAIRVLLSSAAAQSPLPMSMRRALVTGGNQGMGLSTAAALASRHYHVTITVRSNEKGKEAIDAIKQAHPDAVVDYAIMDNAVLSSVKSFASSFDAPKLDLVVCNAGIMNTPFAISSDGYEMQYQVNHLAHFLLTHLLLPKLRASGNARVIFISSRAHMRHPQSIDYHGLMNKTEVQAQFQGWTAYGRSKLSNILTAKALAARLPVATSGVTFFSLHPGLVDTNLLAAGGGGAFQGMDVDDGIKCTLWLATADGLEGKSGSYFHNEVSYFIDPEAQGRGDLMAPIARDSGEATACWTHSLAMLQIAEEAFGQPGNA